MSEGKVLAVNFSEVRGNKSSVEKIRVIEDWGVEGDVHGGNWDRQVSIFPVESLQKVPDYKKEEVLNGEYTENITISGVALNDLMEGSTIRVGEAVIKIMHVGKEKFKENGRPYIVSREGRFGRALKGGKVQTGDSVKVI